MPAFSLAYFAFGAYNAFNIRPSISESLIDVQTEGNWLLWWIIVIEIGRAAIGIVIWNHTLHIYWKWCVEISVKYCQWFPDRAPILRVDRLVKYNNYYTDKKSYSPSIKNITAKNIRAAFPFHCGDFHVDELRCRPSSWHSNSIPKAYHCMDSCHYRPDPIDVINKLDWTI